jgi:hypothetical protein
LPPCRSGVYRHEPHDVGDIDADLDAGVDLLDDLLVRRSPAQSASACTIGV